MKKFILIFNEIHSPATLLRFIKENINAENVLFHGLFIKKLHIDQSFTYAFPNDLPGTAIDFTSETDAEENFHLIKSYQQLFEDECQIHNLNYKSEFFAESSIGDLMEQSTSADLIVTDRKTQFNDKSLKEILIKAHCPILAVAANSQLLQNAVLTFDGSENSKYAIERYSSLFKEWKRLPTQLLMVIATNEEPSEQSPFRDYLDQNFTNAKMTVLHGKPKEEIVSFINKLKQPVVVMGAFGRSAISRWAHSSLAEVVAEETEATLFITHQ